MTTVLAFDIETVPDVEGIRTIHDLPLSMSDQEVMSFGLRLRREKLLNDFFPPYLQKVIAIAFVIREKDTDLHIGSIGQMSDEEPVLLAKFFKKIDQRSPTLVSWNGNGFDLPVLQHRALIGGVSSNGYWNTQGEARWQNYVSRYQMRHIDLMDVLSRYQSQQRAPLSDMAKLCHFPGKLAMSGADVWEVFQKKGGLDKIRHYCERDAVNTYLLFLRFELIRGHLSQEQYADEIALLRTWCHKQDSQDWQTFLQAWQKGGAESQTEMTVL